MKILMIAPQPFLEPRGTPISVYQRIKGLVALGHTVDLVTYHRGQHVALPGLTIHRIWDIPFLKQIAVGPSWHKPLLDILVLVKAISLLLRQRYDLIHSHEEAAFFCVFLAAVFHTRHIYDMHSSLSGQLANSKSRLYHPFVKMFERLEQMTLKRCDAVITIGHDLARRVYLSHPSVPCVVIENLPLQEIRTERSCESGAEVSARYGLTNKQRVVYTGTFEHYQGIDLLVEAAALVQPHYPHVMFILVGGKPHQITRWQQEVTTRGLAARFLFVGTVPLDEVEQYLALADILVSPRTEGMSVPLKIYTYLLSRKPVVATRLPAHTLVLDDETAMLTDTTPDAFSRGIMELLHDPALRDKLSSRAYTAMKQRHSFTSYISKLDQIYAQAVHAEPLLQEKAHGSTD